MCACVYVSAYARNAVYISQLITLNKCFITVLREIFDSQKNNLD